MMKTKTKASWGIGVGTAALTALIVGVPGIATSDRFLVAFTAVIAIGTLASVFQEQVRSWFWHPELSMSVNASPPDCHKTESYQEFSRPTGRIIDTVETYYFRLKVTNSGSDVARDVEVYIEDVRVKQGQGWNTYERFIPQWLVWTGLRNMPALPTRLGVIPRKAERYVDFAYMRDPKTHARDEVESSPGVPEGTPILILDVVPQYLRRGHLLAPGTYEVTLSVTAANHKPVRFIVPVDNRGWHDDEAKMLREGVVVGPVRPG